MSEKISPCMIGDHITSETILREHFRAGGCVQVAGKEYWYRMPTTQLEMLCASSDEWVGSYRSLGELVRTDKVIACDVPALARQIGEAERYGREVEADDEQLRRDVGAPSISTNARRAGYFDGSFSSALDLMLTGSCLTVKGEHPKRYYIIDAWGTLKAHDGNGLWSTPWLTREMRLGKWEFFSDQIPYGPIDESEERE